MTESISFPWQCTNDRLKVLYVLKVVGPTCPCALAGFLRYFPEDPIYSTLKEMLGEGLIGITLVGPDDRIKELRSLLHKLGFDDNHLAGNPPADDSAYNEFFRRMRGHRLNIYYSMKLTAEGHSTVIIPRQSRGL